MRRIRAGSSPGRPSRVAPPGSSCTSGRRGTVVISHELLADADEDQVARVVGSFGSAEVHVVHAARDLARQLPLAWQEWVRPPSHRGVKMSVVDTVHHDGTQTE